MSLQTASTEFKCRRQGDIFNLNSFGIPITSCFLQFLRSAHVGNKGSSKSEVLKHVTRTNSIGTCSSELYIFSLLKLPPPPRAAILVKWMIWGYHYFWKHPFKTDASVGLQSWVIFFQKKTR